MVKKLTQRERDDNRLIISCVVLCVDKIRDKFVFFFFRSRVIFCRIQLSSPFLLFFLYCCFFFKKLISILVVFFVCMEGFLGLRIQVTYKSQS